MFRSTAANKCDVTIFKNVQTLPGQEGGEGKLGHELNAGKPPGESSSEEKTRLASLSALCVPFTPKRLRASAHNPPEGRPVSYLPDKLLDCALNL